MNQKTLKLLLVIVSLCAFAFSFNLILKDEWRDLYAEYFPCKSPITYEIASFDEEFNISRESFREALLEAEKIWEEPIGKNLFLFEEPSDKESDLKINLIYDYRQEATAKIKSLGLIVSDTRHSYDALRAKHTTLQEVYAKDKKEYELRSANFTKRQNKYAEDVNYWNSQNGAPEDVYKELTEEQASLKEEFAEIQKIEKSLNSQINNINALVTVINRLAKTLNLNAAEINTIGKSQGEEFTQGEYKNGGDGEEINVYEFSTQEKLIRLLAHEFGHALGIEHVEDPEAIMYRLNENKDKKLTAGDINALKIQCKMQ